MKIGVISDTHDRLPTFRRALALFKRMQVQAIFHAGDYVAPFAAQLIAPTAIDVPLHAIYGNNDGERKGLKAVLPSLVDGPYSVTLAGRRLVMHHYLDWLTPTDLAGADVVISGHNHEASVTQRDGVLLVNPGECCGWVTDRCTAAILDLSTPKADIIEVHE